MGRAPRWPRPQLRPPLRQRLNIAFSGTGQTVSNFKKIAERNGVLRSSETLRSATGCEGTFGGCCGLYEGKARSAQLEVEFVGLELNVQQASALKVAEIFRLQADVE